MASAVIYSAVDSDAIKRAAMAPTTEARIGSGTVLTYSEESHVPVVFYNKPKGGTTIRMKEVYVFVPIRVNINGLIYEGDKLMAPTPSAKDEFKLTDEQAKTYRFALFRRGLSGCPSPSDSKPYKGRLEDEPADTPPHPIMIRGTFNKIFCDAGTFGGALSDALNHKLAYISNGKKCVDVEATVHPFINEDGESKRIYELNIIPHEEKDVVEDDKK